MEDFTQMDTTVLVDMLAEHTSELVSMMSGRVTKETYILKQELIKRLQHEINARKGNPVSGVHDNAGE
jgi:hypothetical protein